MPAIHVTLFDASTNERIGEADLPAEQLPESFAASTTLHLGEDEWHVEHAEPMTRAEYVQRGHLVIRLRKIDHVDPKQILFSLPTIENALPPVRPETDDSAATLRDDDWRQVELVASTFIAEITAELAAIHAVYTNERKGIGFANLHVRQRIPRPLAGVALRAEEVRASIGSPERRELALDSGLVVGGFAFVVGDGLVYGREDDGLVAELGLANAPPDTLAELTRAHGLVLVDWCGLAAEPAGS